MADVLMRANDPETLLAQFLRDRAGRRMRWGSHDCGLWLADWLMLLRGVQDPAADLRGRYGSKETCDLLLRGSSYPVIIARLVRSAGLRSTHDPGPGDVGLIVGPAGDRVPMGAIRTAGGWAVLGPEGGIQRVGSERTRILAAWGAQCPKL